MSLRYADDDDLRDDDVNVDVDRELSEIFGVDPEPVEGTPRPEFSALRVLEDSRINAQRQRIQYGNRIKAIERGESKLPITVVQEYYDVFEAVEKRLVGDIGIIVREHEMWPWMDRVQGIGPGLAGCLLAHLDIERANTVSSFWKYAGLAVVIDENGVGHSDRRVKGKKLGFNMELKRICLGLVAGSFLRSGSPYRREYDEAKAYYMETKVRVITTAMRADAKAAGLEIQEGWTLKHCDLAARRKMVKLFMSHLWQAWREVRGLPLPQPYAYSVLGHDPAGMKLAESYLKPEEGKGRTVTRRALRRFDKLSAQGPTKVHSEEPKPGLRQAQTPDPIVSS